MFCSRTDKSNAAAGASPVTPQVLPVQTMIASPQTLISDIEVPGTVLPNESTEIHPEVSGRLTLLNIKDGARVAQGELLARLNDGDLQAQLRKLEVQLKIAEQTEQRQAELVKIQGVSQQDYDLSLLQVLSLKADMDIIKEDLRKTEIRAPFAGTLGLKNVSPGAYVTPLDVLTTISQMDALKIQFNIPERYGSLLETGTTVSFTIDGSSKKFTAKVIASEISIDENTRSLAIRARVNQRDPLLIPGAFAKVNLVFGNKEEALMVPNNSIIPVGRQKQLYVYENGKAMMREVTTGVRDSTNIQVLSGLEIGDTVITSAVLFLRPGLEVTIAESQ